MPKPWWTLCLHVSFWNVHWTLDEALYQRSNGFVWKMDQTYHGMSLQDICSVHAIGFTTTVSKEHTDVNNSLGKTLEYAILVSLGRELAELA